MEGELSGRRARRLEQRAPRATIKPHIGVLLQGKSLFTQRRLSALRRRRRANLIRRTKGHEGAGSGTWEHRYKLGDACEVAESSTWLRCRAG